MFPTDVSNDERDVEPEEALLRGLRVCRRDRDFDSSLEANMRALARYFQHFTELSTLISKTIQFGIQTRDGSTEITEIMPLADLST